MEVKETLQGIPVCDGIAIGTPMFYESFTPGPFPDTVPEAAVDAEQERYILARKVAEVELDELCNRLPKESDKSKIFEAHKDLLNDVAMKAEIEQSIATCSSAAAAIAQVYETYAAILSQIEDVTIRERAMDLEDVKNRLLRCLEGKPEQDLSTLAKPVILVAHNLLPSDTARLCADKVLAIVCETGGPTSHSAIIARSYGIPAVLGVADAMQQQSTGACWIVNAQTGIILCAPSEETINEYKQKRSLFLEQQVLLRNWLSRKGATKDGWAIETELNLGRMTPPEAEAASFVDGVGLLRTEFLYMGRPDLPSEAEQADFYSRILRQFPGKAVTIRTLDIGGDKQLDSIELPKEENPFLGNRALRLCFSHPEIFKAQLRACLRASTTGKLWLMFPMVGSVQDFRRAKAALEEAKSELDAEGVPYDPDIKVGIMVEVPSIALMADKVAQEADFASIGTNDLTQYTMAADRMNPNLAEYCRMYNPAVFRLIRMVVNAFHKEGKPVGVCGEMGGDSLASLILVGLGVDKLSMGISHLAKVKKNLSELDMTELKAMASRVCDLDTADDAEQLLKTEWKQFF